MKRHIVSKGRYAFLAQFSLHKLPFRLIASQDVEDMSINPAMLRYYWEA